MPFVYILYSESLDKYYVGSTHGTVEERLYKHNNRQKGFTSAVSDWQSVYPACLTDHLS
ncbi:MAG: GIY-YIG nuclease family protein [Bacteroidales bacterium]|nr:GIY-YIG nuclease family protein [Bacteroidales bacterium]